MAANQTERQDGGRDIRMLVEQEPRYGSVEERRRGPMAEAFHGITSCGVYAWAL